jgi:hypothetical protein
MKQSEVVLAALCKGSLTSMEAFVEFGITRLAARINELRKAGHDIRTVSVNTINRLGGRCTYARYELVRLATGASPVSTA